MQVLTTRPTEEPTWGPEVYLVEHENPRKDIGKDYETALNKVKKAKPKEWNCGEVLEVLEKMGWRVILTNPVHKEY